MIGPLVLGLGWLFFATEEGWTIANAALWGGGELQASETGVEVNVVEEDVELSPFKGL